MRDPEKTLQFIHETMVNAGLNTELIYRRLADAGYILSFGSSLNPRIHQRFWQILEEVTGDPEIGLHLCPHMPAYRARALEYIFLSSADYEQGLLNAFQYQRLISEAFQIILVKDERGPHIRLTQVVGGAPQLRHTEICSVYAYLKLMDAITGDRFKPQSINLHVKPRVNASEYAAVFGCPVDFIQTENEIWFDPALLKSETMHDDPELLRLHRQYADNLLEKRARQKFVDRIQRFLETAYLEGEGAQDGTAWTLARIADQFDTSERHLRFILKETGTNFRTLLKNVRFGGACHELRQTERPLDDIASRTGFSDVTAFGRAFKSWSGLTPSQYRNSSTAVHPGTAGSL